MIDAGGGTVDAITYTVTDTEPLRLKTEAVAPGGALCGSNFLNDAFRDLLKSKVEEDPRYREMSDLTLDQRIERFAMPHFEKVVKRRMDFRGSLDIKHSFIIHGLKENKDENVTRLGVSITK